MTCLIGLHLGAYAMIGADTMIYHPHQITYAPKIASARFGLVAGAGVADLIDTIAATLATGGPFTLEHITRLITREVESYSGPTHLNGIDVRDHTQFFLTTSDALTRSVSIHWGTPENGYELLPIATGRGVPVMPMDAPNGAFDEMVARLAARIRPLASVENQEERDENIRCHCRVIGEEIAWIAARSRTVSPAYQIGVHVPDGIGLSQVLTRPEENPILTWTRNAPPNP
jgi:hypothetical protein